MEENDLEMLEPEEEIDNQEVPYEESIEYPEIPYEENTIEYPEQAAAAPSKMDGIADSIGLILGIVFIAILSSCGINFMLTLIPGVHFNILNIVKILCGLLGLRFGITSFTKGHII